MADLTPPCQGSPATLHPAASDLSNRHQAAALPSRRWPHDPGVVTCGADPALDVVCG